MHPECQQRVFDELTAMFPSRDVDMTRENIEQLVYTEMCIKETMRLLPSVAMISRQSTQSIRIKDVLMPAGISFGIGIYKIHRDHRYWGKDVLTFKPDRFAAENLDKIPPFCYIPFSGGPRNCVGKI